MITNCSCFTFRMEVDAEIIVRCQRLLEEKFESNSSNKCTKPNRRWTSWYKQLQSDDLTAELSAIVTFFLLSCDAEVIRTHTCVCKMDAHVSSRFWGYVLEHQYDLELDDLMDNATIRRLCAEDIPEVRAFCLTYLLKRVSVDQLDVIVDRLTEAGESYYNQELYEDSLRTFCTIIPCAQLMQLSTQWELVENSTNTLTVMVYNGQKISAQHLLQLYKFVSETVALLNPEHTFSLHLSSTAFHSRVISNVIILMWCCNEIISQDLLRYSQFSDLTPMGDAILEVNLQEKLLGYVQELVASCVLWNHHGDGIIHAIFRGLHECFVRAEDLQFTTSSALAITQLYINSGGDINAINNNGDSPLFVLCQIPHDINIDCNVKQIVELLLQQGVHCDVTNQHGEGVMTGKNLPSAIKVILRQYLPLPLQCLSAQSLARQSDASFFKYLLPNRIVEFVGMHAQL